MNGWRQVCSCWWQDFAAAVTIWLAWRTLQFVTCKAMTVILLCIHHYSISQYQLRLTCRDFHEHLLFQPHVAFINSRSALGSLDHHSLQGYFVCENMVIFSMQFKGSTQKVFLAADFNEMFTCREKVNGAMCTGTLRVHHQDSNTRLHNACALYLIHTQIDATVDSLLEYFHLPHDQIRFFWREVFASPTAP